MTLLQLSGGQVWPNLLPILGFRPKRVVFLTSEDPKGEYRDGIQNLQRALAEMGTPFESRVLATRGTNPTRDACQRALAELDSIDLVNLTGGTKPMTLAAHQFASERGIPSFYLDTRRREHPYEDLGTGLRPIEFPALQASIDTLTVRTALRAQGFPAPPAFKTPDATHLAFAREAGDIRLDPGADREIADKLKDVRRQFHSEKGEFLKKGKLKRALQMPITASPDTAWHRYLEAATRHDLCERIAPGEYLLAAGDPQTTSSDTLRSNAGTLFKLLEGIWFELAVLDRLQGMNSFADIGWSVEAEGTEADSRGETDLVAFNRNNCALHFISCKTTRPHGSALDHIQGLRRRATKEGGSFARAELWVFRPKDDRQRETLARHCNEQNVQLRVFSDPRP